MAIVATSCGGGSDSVPADAVAVVNGTEITKSDLDALLDQSKRSYAARKQAFPKAGTPEYQSVQTQYVAYLVELEEFRQAAKNLGVEVTPKEIDKAENDLIKKSFGGKRAEYVKALKKQGFTAQDYREKALAVSVLSNKIFEAVTKDVTVTDQDIVDYYTQNQSQYGSPESRDVRHILIAEKDKNGKVDYKASKAKADQVYAELKAGADFATLAKEDSADPGSKDSGGQLSISRGQTVPEFDKVAFDLKKGEISKPVKTQYGYHVIQAVSDVKKATTTSLDQVKASIKATLLQQKRNDAMNTWVDDLRSDYKGKVSYASGYQPPDIPEAPTSTQ